MASPSVNDALEKARAESEHQEHHPSGSSLAIGAFEKRIAEAVAAKALEFDEAFLDEYGNKHKNLIKLYRLFQSLELEGITLLKPRGIKNRQIHAFLEQCAPQIFTEWKQLQTNYQNYRGASPFLATSEAKERLAAIDAGIEEAFKREDAFALLNLSPKFNAWLNELQGSYLMGRSTGAEDSKKAANAGGNSSENYVAPTKEELCRALGAVVRSYFSSTSLQNRINSGENPFDGELKLAVTFHELIGENPDKPTKPEEIPKSIVLFTNEPLYVGNEKFRVMRISGAFGHGESVVGNQGVNSDTVLIFVNEANPDKLYVLYDNREKPTRLAPVRDPVTGKVNLQKVENPQELVRERLFDDAMIQRLYECGIIVESYFQGPTDMEIVVKGNTIYPVQARPIVRAEQLPTYIDLKRLEESLAAPIQGTIQMSMVVPGKSSVVAIRSSEEILIANSLTEVQNKQLFKQGKHKLVIVAHEETNTHPVINFSGYGIPCLCLEGGREVLEEYLQKLDGSYQLAVCVQSATLYLWDMRKASLEEHTSKGFVIHPAKMVLSLPLTESLPGVPRAEAEVPQEVMKLLLSIRDANHAKIALQELEKLKSHGWIADLTVRKEALQQKLEEAPLAKHAVVPVINGVNHLQEAVQNAFENLSELFDQKSEGRLEKLFSAKILQNLLSENSEKKGTIGQYSFITIGPKIAAAEVQIDYQRELPHEACFIRALMYGMESPVPEIFPVWRAFLLSLERELNASGELQGDLPRELNTLLQTIDKLGALP